MLVMTVGFLLVSAGVAYAVGISGNVGVCADVLPSFALDAGFDVTVFDDAWSITSNTNVYMIPAWGAAETLSLAYDLDFARLAASLSMAFAPFSATGDVSATLDLFSLALREEDPVANLSSSLTIGTSINAAVAPYARLYTMLSLGSHWLSNTTTINVIPFGVTSSLLGYASFGQFSVAEDAVTVTAYGYVSLGIVPFAFNYVQANADVALDGISIRNSVTYWGGSTLDVSSTLTVDLDPVTLTLWASFTPGGTDPFSIGVCGDFAWGPF